MLFAEFGNSVEDNEFDIVVGFFDDELNIAGGSSWEKSREDE